MFRVSLLVGLYSLAFAEELERVAVLLVPYDELKPGTINQQVFESANAVCASTSKCQVDAPIFPTEASDKKAWISAAESSNASITVAVSAFSYAAVTEAAQQHPDRRFILVDYEANVPSNMKVIVFREEEMGYLAGVLAGEIAQHRSKSVGMFGGQLVDPVRRYVAGYTKGLKQQCPDCQVVCGFGSSFAADQAEGDSFGDEFVKHGVDIVAEVGSSAVLKRVTEARVMAIGFGTDEWVTNYGSGTTVGSEYVISSAIKNPGEAVNQTLSALLVRGEFSPGTNRYGVKERAVALSDCHEACHIFTEDVKSAVGRAYELLDREPLQIEPSDEASYCTTILGQTASIANSAMLLRADILTLFASFFIAYA